MMRTCHCLQFNVSDLYRVSDNRRSDGSWGWVVISWIGERDIVWGKLKSGDYIISDFLHECQVAPTPTQRPFVIY